MVILSIWVGGVVLLLFFWALLITFPRATAAALAFLLIEAIGPQKLGFNSPAGGAVFKWLATVSLILVSAMAWLEVVLFNKEGLWWDKFIS